MDFRTSRFSVYFSSNVEMHIIDRSDDTCVCVWSSSGKFFNGGPESPDHASREFGHLIISKSYIPIQQQRNKRYLMVMDPAYMHYNGLFIQKAI